MTTELASSLTSPPACVPRFIGVANAARERGISAMTLYRMIAEGRFPALRLRTRLVVPVDADGAPGIARRQRFISVPALALALDVSAMTLYRLIRDGQFPAVRYRTRLVVPTTAIEQMAMAAISARTVVDPADWVDQPAQGG